jgi:hypothetical protein
MTLPLLQNHLLVDPRIGLPHRIDEVSIVGRFSAARIAPMVSTGGHHGALAVLGVVAQRQQTPIGVHPGIGAGDQMECTKKC